MKWIRNLSASRRFLGFSGGIFQLLEKFIDLVDDAILRGPGARGLAGSERRKAEAGCCDVGLAGRGPVVGGPIDLDVDEVPCGGVSMRVAIFVGPRGSAGEVRGRQWIGVAGEQRVQSVTHLRGEVPIGDEGGDLVAAVSPRGRGAGGQQ
jgi:hypothetical protein